MRPFTQTDTTHGNCWQTAAACILDTEPVALPDQVAIEGHGRTKLYSNALQAYLREHHGMAYQTIWRVAFAGLSVRVFDGLHLMIGPTVRTAGHGLKHCVVGRNGSVVHDPHPSRAGLLSVDCWEVIAPLPADMLAEWRTTRDALRAGGEVRGVPDFYICPCPACGGVQRAEAA
jgi:hypothetical protein